MVPGVMSKQVGLSWIRVALLLLCGTPCDAIAPLYGMEVSGTLPGEYIVVYKSYHEEDSGKLHLLASLWHATDPMALRVVDEYRVGSMSMALVEGSSKAIQTLRNLPSVAYVETNRRVSIRFVKDPVNTAVNKMDGYYRSQRNNSRTHLPSTSADLFAITDSTAATADSPAATADSPATTADSPAATADSLATTADSPAATAHSTSTTTDSSAKCHRQPTGDVLWGLSRINVRTKLPPYQDLVYEFSDVDSGASVDVYVVDTGVYAEHEDFQGRARWGFTAQSVMNEGDDDLNGHGTHVAGTAAGLVHGVAKDANIISVKVLGSDGSGTVAGMLEAMTWITDRERGKQAKGQGGRAVINLSLGTDVVSYSLDAAIQEVIQIGIPVVAAAGNAYSDACNSSPARIASAITVAATNIADKVTSFSNYGPCVNILAPGQIILSAYIGSPSSEQLISGTSQAAPHVTGVLARYLSSLPDTVKPTPAQLQSYLIDTASSDVIVFEYLWESSSPNKLLFQACVDQALPTPPTTYMYDSSTAPSSPSATLISALYVTSLLMTSYLR